MTDPSSYTFDWRRPEHARVSALLVRELFGRGVSSVHGKALGGLFRPQIRDRVMLT